MKIETEQKQQIKIGNQKLGNFTTYPDLGVKIN